MAFSFLDTYVSPLEGIARMHRASVSMVFNSYRYWNNDCSPLQDSVAGLFRETLDLLRYVQDFYRLKEVEGFEWKKTVAIAATGSLIVLNGMAFYIGGAHARAFRRQMPLIKCVVQTLLSSFECILARDKGEGQVIKFTLVYLLGAGSYLLRNYEGTPKKVILLFNAIMVARSCVLFYVGSKFEKVHTLTFAAANLYFSQQKAT